MKAEGQDKLIIGGQGILSKTAGDDDPDEDDKLFTMADGMAMMEQLLELNTDSTAVVAGTLKKGVAAKIIAPAAKFSSKDTAKKGVTANLKGVLKFPR